MASKSDNAGTSSDYPASVSQLPDVPEGPNTGRAISAAEQGNVRTAENNHLRVKALWYLQLSEVRHVYLARFNGRLSLHVREFFIDEQNRHAVPTPRGVFMDIQQARDFMHVLPDIYSVVERTDLIKVSSSDHLINSFKLKCFFMHAA